MNRSGDVIILGGGVIGLTTAYFLAKHGLRVVVCDQGHTGMEASWAGAGILPPSELGHARRPCDRLRALSGQLFPELSNELKERTGIDNGFTRCGGLEFLGHAHNADPHEWYGQGVLTQHLSETDATNLEPALAPNLGPANHVPSMAQLRNPHHMQALRAACLQTTHVTIREETRAHSFIVEGGHVKGVRTADEVLHGDTFVIAAGAWTDHL